MLRSVSCQTGSLLESEKAQALATLIFCILHAGLKADREPGNHRTRDFANHVLDARGNYTGLLMLFFRRLASKLDCGPECS